MSERPEVIDRLREHLQRNGWTLDPVIQHGDGTKSRIGGPLHIEGDGWNASGGYSWPHPPSVCGPGSSLLKASVSVCKGRGFGGLVLASDEITDQVRFKKEPMSPEAWLELAVAMFERAIRGRAR